MYLLLLKASLVFLEIQYDFLWEDKNKDYSFKYCSNVPKFFSNHQDEMKSSYGSAYFWQFFIYLIFQISFHIFLYIRYKKEREPEEPLLIKNIQMYTYPGTPIYYNEKPGLKDQYNNSSDFNHTPQSQENNYPPPPINSNGYQTYGKTTFY